MTWPEARAKLREIAEGLGYAVYGIPPASLDTPKITAMLVPPARSSENPMGGQVDTQYSQRVLLMKQIPDGSETGTADALDDAAEALSLAVAEHSKLEGTVTSRELISWDEMFVDTYPPGGSGPRYAQIIGTIIMTIVQDITVEA